jgi:hypothetical protein
MKTILESIFTALVFEQVQTSELPLDQAQSVIYKKSTGEATEYFILHFIDSTELSNYITVGINIILTQFEEFNKQAPDIKKNTSLIICAKTENMRTAMLTSRNEIFRIEEDEFWFKKYVLVYTDSACNSIQTQQQDIIAFLNTTLYNSEFLGAHRESMFENEIYGLTLQLFLKLPFLGLPGNSDQEFKPINEMIEEKLTESQLRLFSDILNFMNDEEGESWELYKQSFLSMDQNELADNFLTQFESNEA